MSEERSDDDKPKGRLIRPDIKHWDGRQSDPPEAFEGELFDLSLSRPLKPEVSEELIWGLLPEKEPVLIYGPFDSGKSTILCQMAHDLANGRPFLGLQTEQVGVLYMATERPRMIERAFMMLDRRAAEIVTKNLAVATPKGNFDLLVDTEAFLKEVQQARIHFKEETGIHCKVLIIDTLSGAIPGSDESNLDFKLVVQAMQALTKYMTVIVVHHEGKDAKRGSRGGSALLAGFTTAIRVFPIADRAALQGGLQVVKDNGDLSREPIGFSVERVECGTTRQGRTVHVTLIKERLTGSAWQPSERAHTTDMLDIVRDMLDDPDSRQPITRHARAARNRRAEDQWCVLDSDLSAAIRAQAAGAPHPRTTDRALRKERDRLVSEGILNRHQPKKGQAVYWVHDDQFDEE